MDDLFTTQAALLEAPPMARVTCRACRRPALISVDASARICDLCAEDLEATMDVLRSAHRAAFWRVEEAWRAWDAEMSRADAATLARWGAYMDAGDGPAVQETRRKVRAGMAGPLAVLIRAHVAHLDAHAQLVEAERWRNEALDELEMLDPEIRDRYRAI